MNKLLQKCPSRLFQQGIYFFVLLSLWQFHAFGFKPETVHSAKCFSPGYVSTNLFFFLCDRWFYMVCLFMATGISLIGWLFYRRCVLSDLTLWFIYVNMMHFHYEGLHGGHLALASFLFITCFNPDKMLIRFDSTKVVWTALRVQLSLLYLFSAMFKWKEEMWQNGKALEEIFYSPWFNVFYLKMSAPVGRWLSYAVLFFQTTFFMAYFINIIRVFYIIFGLIMHLFVAVCMGLPLFGLILCWVYLLFLDVPEQFHFKRDTKPT